MSLKIFLNSFFQRGVSNSQSPGINKRIVLNNYLLVTILIIHPLSVVVELLLGTVTDIPFILAILCYSGISLYLNQYGFHRLSRILTAIQILGLPLYGTMYYGREGGMLLLLLSAMPVCFVVFDLRSEKILVFLFFLTAIVAGFTLELTNYDIGLPNHKAALLLQQKNYLPTFAFTSIGLFLSIFWLARESYSIENKLEDAVIKAKDGERTKAEFLSTMSHEIRTPLNGILGLADLLRADKTNIDEKLDVLYHASENLKSIVDDILDYSKMEAGKLSIKQESVLLKELVLPLESFYGNLAAQKGIYFKVTCANNLPSNFNGDLNRILQILHNLLNNAVKYTSSGGVSLDIKVDAKNLRFAVHDTGNGIDKKYFKSIFNHFQQIETDNTRNFEGTGLGLAICKRLAKLQKGEIKLESKIGVGSTFTLILPYQKAIAKVDLAVGKKKMSSAPKILFIEDNEINRFVTTRIFDHYGFDYTVFDSPLEALENSLIEPYSIIISDYHMPEINGIQLIKKIRNSSSNPNANTPAIILTADVHFKKEEIDPSCSPIEVIHKPIERNALHEKIQELTATLIS